MVEDRPLLSNEDCNAVYGVVDDGSVCVDTTGGEGTCGGDSGGPCMSRWAARGARGGRGPGDKWKQVGIVSLGYPAGLTRVEAFLDWICQETGVGCAF